MPNSGASAPTPSSARSRRPQNRATHPPDAAPAPNCAPPSTRQISVLTWSRELEDPPDLPLLGRSQMDHRKPCPETAAEAERSATRRRAQPVHRRRTRTDLPRRRYLRPRPLRTVARTSHAHADVLLRAPHLRRSSVERKSSILLDGPTGDAIMFRT